MSSQLGYELFGFTFNLVEFYRLSLQVGDLRAMFDQKENEAARPPFPAQAGVNTLEAKDVAFRYFGAPAPALHGVDVSLRAGEHIALVGYNGAGKTTLTKLLAALYTPDGGALTVNGVPLGQYDPASWQRLVGIVHQDYHIYSLTIAENVLMRRVQTPEDRDRVIRALQACDLYDYVSGLPQGIDTVLTREFAENGVLLSGGQEQKLAVARVLACPEKQLVILDEASSALDPVSESRLNRAILAFCKGKMLVLISHRLSLTKEMDHIYYMEKGTVAEHGTHAQLMAQNGHYAQMYRLQAQNYVSTPAAEGTQPDPAAKRQP